MSFQQICLRHKMETFCDMDLFSVEANQISLLEKKMRERKSFIYLFIWLSSTVGHANLKKNLFLADGWIEEPQPTNAGWPHDVTFSIIFISFTSHLIFWVNIIDLRFTEIKVSPKNERRNSNCHYRWPMFRSNKSGKILYCSMKLT